MATKPQTKQTNEVITPKFRVSYPNVFKPKLNDLNGENEYSLVALFPPGADLSKLKAAAKKACEEKWGKDSKAWPKNLKLPFRDQADRAKTDPATGKTTLPAGHVAGAIFLNLKSKKPNKVVNEQLEDIIDSSEFYGGCYAEAAVTAYAYDIKGNKGIAFGLGNIHKLGDGEAFGAGRRDPTQQFVPIEKNGGSEEVGLTTGEVDLDNDAEAADLFG